MRAWRSITSVLALCVILLFATFIILNLTKADAKKHAETGNALLAKTASTDTTTQTTTPTIPWCVDINGDGLYATKDSLIVDYNYLVMFVNNDGPDPVGCANGVGDINGDGSIDATDLQILGTLITNNYTPTTWPTMTCKTQNVCPSTAATTQSTTKAAYKKMYFYAGSLAASKTTSDTQMSYYVQDHLGSDMQVLNGVLVAQQNKYAPFGETTSTGTSDNTFKYTGKPLDDETGLYYYGARYYNPMLGRFMEADALKGDAKDPRTMNRFAYTLNNPLKNVDPTGNGNENTFEVQGYSREDRQAVAKGNGVGMLAFGGMFAIGLAAAPFLEAGGSVISNIGTYGLGTGLTVSATNPNNVQLFTETVESFGNMPTGTLGRTMATSYAGKTVSVSSIKSKLRDIAEETMSMFRGEEETCGTQALRNIWNLQKYSQEVGVQDIRVTVWTPKDPNDLDLLGHVAVNVKVNDRWFYMDPNLQLTGGITSKLSTIENKLGLSASEFNKEQLSVDEFYKGIVDMKWKITGKQMGFTDETYEFIAKHAPPVNQGSGSTVTTTQ